MKRRAKGYFTLEVTLLMPVILGITLFVLYIWFVRYNRSIMEQNLMDLVWNARMDNGVEIEDEPLFVLWEETDREAEYRGNRIYVSAEGRCLCPLMGMDVLNSLKDMDFSAEYSADVRRQTQVLRTLQNIEDIIGTINGSEGE